MSMQMSALGLAFAACVAGCAPVQPEPLHLTESAPDCARIGATKGLRIYVLAKDGWDLWTFDGANVTQSTVQSAPDQIEDPKVAERLTTGETLGLPAARSPNERYFAGSVVSNEPGGTPRELVIKDDDRLRRLSASSGFGIVALAWSPGSDHFAVVEETFDFRARTLKDLVAPHGVEYNDVLLRLYTPFGQLACQTVVAQERRTASIRIGWSPK